MTVTQESQTDPLDSMGREDLLRIARRDRWVKEMLTSRLTSVVTENVELLAIIRDLQIEMAQLQAIPRDGDASGPQPS
jgi:hypothetical protein